MTRTLWPLALTLGALAVTATAQSDDRITITTFSHDHTYSAGSITCPAGSWGDGFTADIEAIGEHMPLRKYEQMFDLLTKYEGDNGVAIHARTRVRNGSEEEDAIRTEATGPLDDTGRRLCSLLAGYV